MKTAIIGGGICGLYLAWKLSEEGNQVTVFEKKSKIGKEVCSGLFSEKILEFIPESEKLIQNRINFVLIHFPKKTLKVNFYKNFLVMDHAKLDKITGALAQKAGAKIILNRKVDNLPENFEKTIGCDGAASVIRNILKIQNPTLRLAIQGFLNKKDFSDFVETWPTPNGFLWKIPRGKNVEYGIIENPEIAYDNFKNFLKKKNLKINNIKSWLIPSGGINFFVPKNYSVTLCGDAAALTKPWSGGGVIWALEAADILLKNFPDFIKYRVEIKKSFYFKIILSKITSKILYFLGFRIPWLLPKNFKFEGDSLSFKI